MFSLGTSEVLLCRWPTSTRPNAKKRSSWLTSSTPTKYSIASDYLLLSSPESTQRNWLHSFIRSFNSLLPMRKSHKPTSFSPWNCICSPISWLSWNRQESTFLQSLISSKNYSRTKFSVKSWAKELRNWVGTWNFLINFHQVTWQTPAWPTKRSSRSYTKPTGSYLS